MNEKKRRLAGVGALCTALALSSGYIFTLPDFLDGFLIGSAIALMILSMLPNKTLEKLERWKRHG